MRTKTAPAAHVDCAAGIQVYDGTAVIACSTAALQSARGICGRFAAVALRAHSVPSCRPQLLRTHAAASRGCKAALLLCWQIRKTTPGVAGISCGAQSSYYKLDRVK